MIFYDVVNYIKNYYMSVKTKVTQRTKANPFKVGDVLINSHAIKIRLDLRIVDLWKVTYLGSNAYAEITQSALIEQGFKLHI